MERKLILDLFTGVLAVLVFGFLWFGIISGRKWVDWKNSHEGVAYVFMCLLLAVATLGLLVNAYFWFTEHIIYIP